METKGINKNAEIESVRRDSENCNYFSQKAEELRMKSMINSCFTYGGYEIGSHWYNQYIIPYKAKLPKGVFEEVYQEQTTFLKEHATIQHSVYTDGEGCTYNNLVIN